MKRCFKVTENVNDRNEYARLLADGENDYDVWFSSGVVRHYDANGNFWGTEVWPCPADAIDSTEWLQENMWVPSNCDCMENILGDVALIYYIDDDMAADDCIGYQIFRDGVPMGMKECKNGDVAYNKLVKMGFRY